MEIGDIIEVTFRDVKFVSAERKMQGAIYGTYESYFVGYIKGYRNGITVVDSLAKKSHPDWDKKTCNRASTLAAELKDKKFKVRIIEVYPGVENFEAELV